MIIRAIARTKATYCQRVAAIFNEIKERLKDKKFDSLRKVIENWFFRVLVEKKVINSQQWAEITRKDDMLAEKFDDWKEEFIEEGKAEGIKVGKAEGIIEGKAEGLTNQKNTLLQMLLKKFNNVPTDWKEKINHLTSPDIISALTISLLSVNSPE